MDNQEIVVSEKVYKTPIYVRNAQKRYYEKWNNDDKWKENKKQIAKNWYQKNKEKVKEKYREKKEKERLIKEANDEIIEEITQSCGC
jgi:hypothetical protein